ncbi:MAG: cell division protein FtsL [Gammaproteobacteria bacterium]|nr:MAG: cell division protein FtsL [Gammaproteobacteria bacterium]
MKRGLVLTVLFLCVLASAIGVVYVKHQSRVLFHHQQDLISEKEKLEVDWGRLQLEQSTWAMHGRIDSIARERLGMSLPETDAVEMLN